MRVRSGSAGIVLAAVTLAVPALAGTNTGSLEVQAVVVPNCTVDAGVMIFGNYDGERVDTTGTVTARCNAGTTFTVGLNEGSAASATVSSRRMTRDGGGGTLDYELYRDPGRTENWGNTPDIDTVGGTGAGAPLDLTVFGRIPAGQNALVGDYGDSILVTITF